MYRELDSGAGTPTIGLRSASKMSFAKPEERLFDVREDVPDGVLDLLSEPSHQESLPFDAV